MLRVLNIRCEGVDPSSTYASTGHFREGEKCNGNGEGFFWSVDVSPPSASPPRFADLLARYSKARSRCQVSVVEPAHQ